LPTSINFGVDPWSAAKLEALNSARPLFDSSAVSIELAVMASLWGNRNDLSLSAVRADLP
jgi:hypothetical protein